MKKNKDLNYENELLKLTIEELQKEGGCLWGVGG